MRLVAEHGGPLRHDQWLQLLMNRPLLDAVAEPTRLHVQLRRNEVKAGVLLRRRAVVRVRVDVLPRCRWRRGLMIVRCAVVVRHRSTTANGGLRQGRAAQGSAGQGRHDLQRKRRCEGVERTHRAHTQP